MNVDLEKTLARELREVAEGLHVPAVPPLPERAPRPARRRSMLMAAAAVVVITAGVGGVVATVPDGRDPQPVQPSPSFAPSASPSPDAPVERIPGHAPTVPYVADLKLHTDGTQVPGRWWAVRPAGETWIAWREDFFWWWGRGPTPQELPNGEDVTPALSPDGKYIAVVRPENGVSMLTVLDTETGENIGGTPVSLGRYTFDNAAYVLAVLDDGRVVVRRGATDLLWVPGAGNRTVDLSETAPGQMVVTATPAGLVVTDGDGGQPYLAELSDGGELTLIGELPEYDDLAVSPGAKWMAWTPGGTTGGEVTSVPSLEVQTLDGDQQGTLTAPAGWRFKVRTWVWEDDDHLVSTVWSTDVRRERMVRCSPQQARCVLIDLE